MRRRLKRLERLGHRCSSCLPVKAGVEVIWHDDPSDAVDLAEREPERCPDCGVVLEYVVRWMDLAEEEPEDA